MIVLDASVALTWCFEDEATKATDVVLEYVRLNGAVTPNPWFLEVANTLLQAEKRQRLTAHKVQENLELLVALPVAVRYTTPKRSFHKLTELARDHTLTIYDACYLELASRLNLPLATMDKKLREAGLRTGVNIIPDL